MEYVEGQSLDQVVSPGEPLAWRQATRAVRDAAAGLDAAHKLGLIHRDIKPANLIRATDGVTKVVDFGLARAQAAQTQLTQQGSILGTPAYMAPEVWRRNETDARSDLYALTCTYYCLLTGEPPFDADNPVALGYQHTHEPLPDPRQRVPDLPNAVCRVLAKGASKDPQDRYQTAAEMLHALEALLATPPLSLMSDSGMEPEKLPSLQTVDLLGPGDRGLAAAAIESQAPVAPIRARSSPEQLRRMQRSAHKPKSLRQSLRESLRPVGLPVLMGIGGGMLLVLMIILLYLFSNPSRDAEVTYGPPSSGVAPAPAPGQTAEPGSGSGTPGEVATPETTSPSQAQPEPVAPAPEPEPAPAEQTKPAGIPGTVETKPPQGAEQPPTTGFGPAPLPKQEKEFVPQPETPVPGLAPPEPAKPEPSAKPPQSAPPPSVAKPAVEAPPTPEPPALSRESRAELFAALTEFAVEVELGGDPKSVPKEMARGVDFLAQAIRGKLEASEKMLDLIGK